MGEKSSQFPWLQIPRSVVRAYADASLATIVETLWPTRCCICEAPGDFLCDTCRRNLPYLDQWLACPRCGAPYGMVQCTECNELSLSSTRRIELPFSACVSAVHFDEASARVVRVFKDAGERGLADFLGYAIASVIPPEWLDHSPLVVPVPATGKAKTRRGFDHGLEIAQVVAGYLRVPCVELLVPGKARDQRALGRMERFRNAAGTFSSVRSCEGAEVILVDDVYTTGATVCAATDALLDAGAHGVRCATFARVY